MKKFIFLLLFPILLAFGVFAQSVHYNLVNGLAIEGYDPVSYFGDKPLKGKKELAVAWQGATYYFANSANQAAFKKEPSKYLPQYGGWCAYAMGNTGEQVEVDPGTYKIINGKLYLYYNHLFNNTLKLWNKDESRLKTKADANWQKLNR